MYTIAVNHKFTGIKRYNSNILPMVGDVYPSSNFEDNNQRTIISRTLIMDEEHLSLIIVETDYSFPELVKEKQNDK